MFVACVTGNPNTTAVDYPPDFGRFVIPPAAYKQTPWLEQPTDGFNPIFPWIDANIQNDMNDNGKIIFAASLSYFLFVEETCPDGRWSEEVECSTKRTYQPNVRKRKMTHGFLVR